MYIKCGKNEKTPHSLDEEFTFLRVFIFTFSFSLLPYFLPLLLLLNFERQL